MPHRVSSHRVSRPLEPRPLKQHQLKTVMLRVPTPVWSKVSTGRVHEFRAATGNAPRLWKFPLPILALAYRRRLGSTDYDYRLMVLEAVRREMLGAITEEGLAAAGYEGDDALARFRRDWMIAEKKRFEPLRKVVVFTVRPIQDDGDLTSAGLAIIEHLYGDYLAQEAHTRPRTVSANGRATQGVGVSREAVTSGSV